MSKLTTVDNIKLPYPIEGVVRTAQLDDTIAPEDSVQLAVNMNFDRVGATQTRLGVTNYADSLVEEINNFGTLKNSLITNGYNSISRVGAVSDITGSTTFEQPSAVKVNDTKVAIFWRGTGNDGYCRLFEIDSTTGTISAIGTEVEFDTANNSNNKAILISTNRILNVWTGTGSDGFAQCFDVSGDTIVPESTAFEFDTSEATNMSLVKVDDTHALVFYSNVSSQGTALALAVNSGTGAVTAAGSPLSFGTTNLSNSCVAIGNGTHFLNFWNDTGAGKAQVFSVNTGTWAITAIGTALSHDTLAISNNAISLGDGKHFVNVYETASGFVAQAFNVNTGTYAVTEVGTAVTIDAGGGSDLFALGFGDGQHIVVFYTETVGDGNVQMLEVDLTSYDITKVGNQLEGYNFSGDGISGVVLSNYKVMSFWEDLDTNLGEGAMFQAFGPLVSGSWLYAAHGDEVSNLSGSTWTSRRSGLAQVSKPRFSQYLGYIWMVNGNETIGGDPVATSSGGAFGTDLIPEGFPAGDFIHAGFEGRVWVADKTLGTIYYTDIVQFIPPSIYLLTYDPDVNFISNIAPQTGQTFTALHRVPRALLVFTEDSIYRIYGATSIDAYPAYNVGTYSQESIIETKTGIFFHHSSGFYQFDYGSQPVEISRRIIDFVKAIPRSYYDDVKGVYDGFDNVMWYVGPVTVEGVTFTNCALRYTISTQVWTVYDYKGNNVTAMIIYDNGTAINHIMGTSTGLVGAIDSGKTDFGQPFYYEYIDRWRSYTDMYCEIKQIQGINAYTENAAGANIYYQIQKSGANAWKPLATINEKNNSLFPNVSTDDFDVARLRIAGTTSGVPVVIHGIEIRSLIVKGFNEN